MLDVYAIKPSNQAKHIWVAPIIGILTTVKKNNKFINFFNYCVTK